MKEETNNEMDLLLRRLGRRADTPTSDTKGDVDHLDADELNAYAENVLPAAARARYTEHLAACARCRTLVVQLSSSAGVVPAVETVKAAGPSALKKFLASLFSPLVLRYAIPALGLIVVAAIGVFVLRQKKQDNGDSIAQIAQAPAPTSIVTPNATPPASANSTSDQVSTSPKPARSTGSPENQVAGAAPQGAPAAPAPAAVGGTVDSMAKKEQQPVATDSPLALTTLTPGVVTNTPEPQPKTAEREEAAKEKDPNERPPEKSEEAAKTKSENRKLAGADAARSAPSADAGHGFSSANVQGIARAKTAKDSEAQDKNRDDSKTITVGGHHFQKHDGVWLDTAYNSSRSPISVTRGSEQYRALIADEPGIKTIADQLDGEILLMWKGNAYRIK